MNQETQVLYFSTPTCGPCRSFYPICQLYFKEKGVEMDKIDLSEESNFHYKDAFALTSVPTIVVLRGNDIIGKVVGSNLENLKKIEF